jgi:hypothetical protein
MAIGIVVKLLVSLLSREGFCGREPHSRELPGF